MWMFAKRRFGLKSVGNNAVRQPENGIGLSTLPIRIPRGKPIQRHYGSNQPYNDFCTGKTGMR